MDDVPALWVVMGVSGSGKSTVGAALAARTGVAYADADDFHSPDNVAKMAAGRPLTDQDRAPWLRSIGGWLAEHMSTGGVVSCSALRRRYREVLRAAAPGVLFLHLDGDAGVVTTRVATRPGHFMPASLVTSQLETLEPLGDDEPGLVADLTWPVDRIVDRVALPITTGA